MATTNIKAVREFRGLSQEEAAQLLGVKIGTLRNWEQGKNDPGRENLMKLRKVYRVTADALLIPGYPMPGQSPSSSDLDAPEEELISNYRATDADGKDLIMRLSRYMAHLR